MPRLRSLAAAVLVAATCLAPAASASAAPTAAERVLAYINKARKAEGLKPLKMKPNLTKAAAAHGKRMLRPDCGLSHQCPGEAGLGKRLKKAGVTNLRAAGENIGYQGYASKNVKSVAKFAIANTKAMLAERPPNDGHRRNLLSPSYKRIGLWVYRDSKGLVWMVQDFAN